MSERAETPPHATPLALDESLGFRISRLARERRQRWAGQLETLQLTPPEASVLRALEESPGCSLRQLARVLGSEVMKTKRCVDALEQRGLLVSHEVASDQRLRAFELTPRGLRQVVRVDALVQANEDALRDALGASGYRQLKGLLDRLERALDFSETS